MPDYRAYRIKFRKCKGGKVLTWVRFGSDMKIVKVIAKRAIEKEYGKDAKIISITRAKRY